MKNARINKIKIKSNLGATMTDVIIALMVIIIFGGVISTGLYSAYKTTLQSRVTELATSFAITILEDIDKVSYDEVQAGMEESYISKLSIPDNYNLTINVSNYNNGKDELDLIKNVELIISYEFAGNSEKIVINKLKIKEI